MPEEEMTEGWKMYLEGQRRKRLPPQPERKQENVREATPEERALIEEMMRPPFTEQPQSSAPLGSGQRAGGGWKWEVSRG